MKTKEFIERVEKLGFKIMTIDYIDGQKDFKIYQKNNCFAVAIVCKNYRNIFNTNTRKFSELSQEIQRVLFDLLVDYADTPVEEREELKKYYIRQKHIKDDWNYLNYNIVSKEWVINTSHETSMLRVQFTLSELPDWVHEMLGQGHLFKEEVE